MIKKVVFSLVAVCLSFLSVWAPIYLSASLKTPEMDEYINQFDEFIERGTLSVEEKLILDEKEILFRKNVNSDDYMMKKFLSDYLFIPLLVILLSIFWFALGVLISFESLLFKVSVFVGVAGLGLYSSPSIGLLYFLIYLFFLFLAVFLSPKLLPYIKGFWN